MARTRPPDFPSLYPITDRRLSGLSHAEQVERLSAGGATLIQLREKHLSPREFYDEADAALRVARVRGVRLIINDRADLALALGADGVHVGQDDLPPEAARRLLGDRALIGFSTHTISEAASALLLDIDYLAVGPVFGTSTKENPSPTVGLEGIARVRRLAPDACLVAIGGITAENAPGVIEAGADAVAVISTLLADPARIEARTRQLLASIQAKTE